MALIGAIFYRATGIDGHEEFSLRKTIELHAYGVGGFTKFSGQATEIGACSRVQEELQEQFYPSL